MKPKIDGKSGSSKPKFKKLKSIKKLKNSPDAKTILKNLKEELNSSLQSEKERRFSKFVKTYDGRKLTIKGKQLLQFFIAKNLSLPSRKKKFLNLLKSSVGEKVPMSDEQKLTFFEMLKKEYASLGKRTTMNSSITDEEGFIYVGKNKRKKNTLKVKKQEDDTNKLADISMDEEVNTQTKNATNKNKKITETETDNLMESSKNVKNTKKEKKNKLFKKDKKKRGKNILKGNSNNTEVSMEIDAV